MSVVLVRMPTTWKGCELCDVEFDDSFGMAEHCESSEHQVRRGGRSDDEGPGLLLSDLLDQSTLDFIERKARRAR